MRALQRKLLRDLWGNAGTLATVVAIIAVGTGSYIGLASAQRILTASQSAYYRDYRLADFWVDVKKAPLTAVEQVAAMPGIADVEPRVVFDLIIDLPAKTRPLVGRLISTPPHDFHRTINGICLIRGTGFSPGRDEEVILSESFAQAHGLRLGDRIDLILNRKRESFVIIGTAISPEFVYMVRGQGDVLPDPEHFGILYVKDSYAREVLDFKDACNQIVGRLVPGAQRDLDRLLQRIDRLLKPYGVILTTPRERQSSHRFLSDEIRGLGVSAAIMPVIFLGVAALVLNVLMTRLAERQRSIVGTLKAIGYSDRRILVHFLGFGLAVGVAGGLAGNLLGVTLAAAMVEMYKDFFQFPAFVYRAHPLLLLTGLAISVFFSVAGTAKGAWAVLRLQPAEAMRQKPPERGGAIFLERFQRAWRSLGFRTHIALRSMMRNRIRTATGIVSTALATSIIFTSLVLYDSMFYLVDFQFEQVARSDVDIGMRDERSNEALFEARALPGVDYAEPILALACELRNGPISRRMGVMGLAREHRLTTPTQPDMKPVVIPPEGLVLSTKLAEIMQVDVGNALELTPVRGRPLPRYTFVAGVTEGFLGLECYADRRYLSRLVGESAAVNSIQLAVDPTRSAALYAAIKKLPNAQGLSVRADTRAGIEETLLSTSAFSLGLLVIFAGVIAFGTMLNNSLVEIGDRLREVSTFRVLGYQPGQVAGIFLRQNLITFLLGILLAAPLGYGMVLGTSRAYDTELFRMPVVIRPMVALASAALVWLFVLAAQWFVYRQVCKLDWLEGIKVKE